MRLPDGRALRWTGLVVSLAVAVACDDGVTEPREVQRLGILEHFGESGDVVSLPTVVAPGEEFAVIVRTYGGGCTTKGTTRVDTVDESIRVTPLDVTVADQDAVCIDILKRLTHRADLVVEEPGQQVILVRGRAVGAGDEDREIQLERTVTVEPD